MGCSLAANQARNELQEKSLPGWVGNLAVLGTLEGESIQPLNFTSTAETSLNVPGLLQFFQVWKRGEERSSIYQNGVVFWWIFFWLGVMTWKIREVVLVWCGDCCFQRADGAKAWYLPAIAWGVFNNGRMNNPMIYSQVHEDHGRFSAWFVWLFDPKVFFQMTRHMPIWSHIVVDAPAPFDFTELCIVNHLHPEYYQATAAKKHAAVLGCGWGVTNKKFRLP